MRIISGKLKGASLFRVKDRNTRPLKDLTRESIFNLLIHSNRISLQIEHSHILDLYAGTGSFGLECISRGALFTYFVENNKSALQILEKNIQKLKIKQKTKVFLSDSCDLVEKQSFKFIKFDIIFCDPPFKFQNTERLIKLIYEKNLLKENGIIILHRKKTTKDTLPSFFKIIDTRSYGLSKIIFGKF